MEEVMSRLIGKGGADGGSCEKAHYHEWGKNFMVLYICQFLPIFTLNYVQFILCKLSCLKKTTECEENILKGIK